MKPPRRLSLLLFAGVLLSACGSAETSSSSVPSGLRPPVITEAFTLLPCSQKNNIGIEGCAEHQAITADKRIDSQLALLFTILDERQKRTLVRAERAWLTYRRADCGSTAALFYGGSVAPVEFGSCLVSDDHEYSAHLHAYFDLLEQGSDSAPIWP